MLNKNNYAVILMSIFSFNCNGAPVTIEVWGETQNVNPKVSVKKLAKPHMTELKLSVPDSETPLELCGQIKFSLTPHTREIENIDYEPFIDVTPGDSLRKISMKIKENSIVNSRIVYSFEELAENDIHKNETLFFSSKETGKPFYLYTKDLTSNMATVTFKDGRIIMSDTLIKDLFSLKSQAVAEELYAQYTVSDVGEKIFYSPSNAVNIEGVTFLFQSQKL